MKFGSVVKATSSKLESMQSADFGDQPLVAW